MERNQRKEQFIQRNLEKDTFLPLSSYFQHFKKKKMNWKSFNLCIGIILFIITAVILIHFFVVCKKVRQLKEINEKNKEELKKTEKTLSSLRDESVYLQTELTKKQNDYVKLEEKKNTDRFSSSTMELDVLRNMGNYNKLMNEYNNLQSTIKEQIDLAKSLQFELEEIRRHGIYSP